MTPLTEDIIVHGDMVRKIVDLRAYKGKVCYIGLRHYNSADQFNVYLDDVEVKKAVAHTSVTLDQTSLALGWGETAKLKATVYPVNADPYTVTWTSDAPSVATVDDNGKVTAVGGGKSAHCIVHIDPTGPAKPTVVINTAFGGRTVKFNCADADAEIYYQFGSTNITTMCQHVNAGETIFLNEPMTGNRAAMYFKSYKDGKWSVLAKWGVHNVQIAQPIITRSGDPYKNES